MNRREFVKTIGLSIVAISLLAPQELLAASSNDKIIIHLFCYGGADFRYMFAPTSDNVTFYNTYFDNQLDLIDKDEYENISINSVSHGIKKNNVSGLKDMINNEEIAIIPNIWFSDNRDHQHSIARNLLGDNDNYTKSTSEKDGWMGRIAGELQKNSVTASNNWIFATRTNTYENSKSINISTMRPFGITNTNNVVNKALERYYKTETTENPIVKNLVNIERGLKSFSDKINSKLSGTNRVNIDLNSGYLEGQVTNLFDAIDCRDIFNSNYFHIDFPGWDFHGNYANNANSKIPDVFGNNGAIDVIKKELSKRGLWNNTTLIISSEFGRQLKQNGIEGKEYGLKLAKVYAFVRVVKRLKF